MPNTNCLEGLRCPNCKQEDELLVRATAWASVRDSGTDFYADSLKMKGEVEFDEASDAACPACQHEGKLAEFKLSTP